MSAATLALRDLNQRDHRGSSQYPLANEVWRDGLIKNPRGQVSACLENALVALNGSLEWRGVLHYDESSLRVVAQAQPPWDTRRTTPFAWTVNTG